MQLYATVLATLFITSSVLANAIPEVADEATLDTSPALFNATESTAVEDGVPDFDPLELTGPPTIQDEAKRDLDDQGTESAFEKRSAASTIVSCAAQLKGTRYLYGGCKAKAPFGPAKGGLDCSCLSRTCIYKGTHTQIPRTAATQYTTKDGKCHQIPRSSAKAGDLVFWGCGEKGGVHHVAIVAKPGWIWHAPHTGDHVREAKIWTQGICSKAVRCW